LNGEIPGVADKKQISIAWLASQTLVVRGWMKPVDNEAEWNLGSPTDGILPITKDVSSKKSMTFASTRPIAGRGMQQTNGQELNGDKASSDDHVDRGPKCWLRERTGGEFERSFTFPTEVNPDGVRARLENGVLKMMVPRIAGVVEGTKWIPIE
jgi:HSP20 family molecular chaperone IbpA